MSTKSTFAPQYKAQLEDATNEFGVVHNISPFFNPKERHAICKPLVAEFTATAYLDFTNLLIFFSNFGTTGLGSKNWTLKPFELSLYLFYLLLVLSMKSYF